MTRKISVFLIFTYLSTQLFSQSIIKVMQYNLMQYSSMYGGCTSLNNNLDSKDSNFRKIFQYINPDIITVQEIGNSAYYYQRILDNVLNINGVNYWKNGNLTSLSGGTLSNMIFYDSRKLTLKTHTAISNSIRDFNIYQLYFNSTNLSNGDTTYIIPIVCHLKAGSTAADENTRNQQVQQLMNKLNQWNKADNYILCGDLNVYKSSEPCFQQIINNSNLLIRFYDPINQLGNWNNNSSYKNYHTQSTHNAYNNCFASGGLDDRFDFILVSNDILNNTKKVKAITSSYKAIGQDGNRFNSSIISPSNSTIPYDIANALYSMSDHLPVVMQFEIDENNLYISNIDNKQPIIKIVNPTNDNLTFYLTQIENTIFYYNIFDSFGNLIKNGKFNYNQNQETKIDITTIASGLYIFNIFNNQHFSTIKFIKKIE